MHLLMTVSGIFSCGGRCFDFLEEEDEDLLPLGEFWILRSSKRRQLDRDDSTRGEDTNCWPWERVGRWDADEREGGMFAVDPLPAGCAAWWDIIAASQLNSLPGTKRRDWRIRRRSTRQKEEKNRR